MRLARPLAPAALLLAVFAAAPAAHAQTAGTTPTAARDLAAEEANRALVVSFYEDFFIDHKVEEAGAAIAEDYIQHNPNVPTGKAPVIAYFTGFFAENPEARSEIKRSAAQGDLVWLHVHARSGPDDLGRAVVDIFRVEDGMIVEHWDVVQPVPATSANDNTMF